MAVDSAQYKVTPRSMILRRVKFRAVSCCPELSHEIVLCDFAQHDMLRNLTPRSIILRGTPEKYKYLSKNDTKNKTILTHWSVAQASLNDEKTEGRKSRWTVPLRDNSWKNRLLNRNMYGRSRIYVGEICF